MSQQVGKPGKNLNCGSCAGLKRERVFETRCVELGRIPTSRACKQHVPDAVTLMQDQEKRMESFLDMAQVLRGMSPNDHQIFAAILMNERKTRKAGFSFMEKVYVRVQGQAGRNYMHNFATGYVLDADKEHVRIISESAKTMIVMPNERISNSLYTVRQFAVIRAEIVAEKKWVDPEVIKSDARMSSAIANLDQADAAGLLDTPVAARRKIKKAKEKDDLVSFVAKMNRGITKTRKDSLSLDEEFSVNW